MTPLKNYASPITGRGDQTPRQYAMSLHASGMPLDKCCAMSGFDLEADLRQQLVAWSRTSAILAVLLLLFVLFSFVPDVKADPAPPVSPHNEATFAACLNGMTIQVGDVLFQCLTAGHVKKGG